MGVLVNDQAVELRTNSENGFLALLSGLEYAHARSGGKLTSALMNVRAWEKSTRGSSYKSFTTVSIDYVSHDTDQAGASASMNAYGEALLTEWESQFACSQPEELMIPDAPHVDAQCFTVATHSAVTVDSAAMHGVAFPLPTI